MLHFVILHLICIYVLVSWPNLLHLLVIKRSESPILTSSNFKVEHDCQKFRLAKAIPRWLVFVDVHLRSSKPLGFMLQCALRFEGATSWYWNEWGIFISSLLLDVCSRSLTLGCFLWQIWGTHVLWLNANSVIVFFLEWLASTYVGWASFDKRSSIIMRL